MSKPFVAPLFALAVLSALLSVSACDAAGDDDDDGEEGEGEEGEGEEGEGEEGEGEEGEGEEGEGEGGGGCDVDADCAGDETCQTLIQDGAKACFNTCTAGAACTTNVDRPGTCVGLVQDGPTFCVELSLNLGPCGNLINAGCDVAGGGPGVCLADTSGVGFCARFCTPADPTTCAQAGIPPNALACGCTGTEVCTTEPNLGVGGGDGLCSEPTTVGDACGVSADGLGLCTDGQTCEGFAPPEVVAGVCAGG